MSDVIFVDTETTGLDPDRHEVWEIALAEDNAGGGAGEYVYRVKPDLTKADPTALRICRYYERAPRSSDPVTKDEDPRGWWWHPPEAALAIAHVLDGKHLVGAVVDFDARFLTRFLNRWGQAATWHYHLIDIETLAVGWLRDVGKPLELPWDSNEISRQLGVDPDDYDRHTALGDALWVRAMWRRIMA